jgi:hypothetical protein
LDLKCPKRATLQLISLFPTFLNIVVKTYRMVESAFASAQLPKARKVLLDQSEELKSLS